MTPDRDELAMRLKRIRDLSERLRSAQADSVEAQDLAARIQRETAQLNHPLASTPKNRK